MSAPQANPPQPAAAPVPEGSDGSPLTDTEESTATENSTEEDKFPLTEKNHKAAKRGAIALAIGVVSGVIAVVSKTLFANELLAIVAIIFSLVFLALALVFAGAGVVIGSSTPQEKEIVCYKFAVAFGFFSPVLAVALAGLLNDNLVSVRYIAILVAVAIFVEFIIQAMLKSDVKGPRRDALELASVVVGAAAAVWVLFGAFQVPS